MPFLDPEHGVTPESLRIFPFSADVMQKFRAKPLWGFETTVKITDPQDCQIFFSGRTEEELERLLQEMGLVGRKTKRTYKGFGPRG